LGPQVTIMGQSRVHLSLRDLRQHAKGMATQLLAAIRYDPKANRNVPLGSCAAYLQTTVKARPPGQLRAHGVIWAVPRPQASLFGDYEIEISRAGYPARFTLAHELAHRTAQLWLTPEETESWGEAKYKVFLDAFAGYLLLPDDLLLSHLALPDTGPFYVTLNLLRALRDHLRVSYSCLIKRFSDLSLDKKINIGNCTLSASAAVSAGKKSNYAPRVIVASTPSDIFIPSNTRLRSLGLETLADLYWRGEPCSAGYCEQRYQFQSRSDWNLHEKNAMFHYVILMAVQERRIMIISEVM